MAVLTLADGVRTENETGSPSWDQPCREEDHWDEPDLPEQRTRTDLEELQGPWSSAQGREQAELLIAGSRYTIRFAGGVIYMGVLTVDVSARPRTMDMHIEEGPEPFRGKTTRCIYELVGDRLRWCATFPGSKERLATFPSQEDPKYLYLTFHRH